MLVQNPTLWYMLFNICEDMVEIAIFTAAWTQIIAHDSFCSLSLALAWELGLYSGGFQSQLYFSSHLVLLGS